MRILIGGWTKQRNKSYASQSNIINMMMVIKQFCVCLHAHSAGKMPVIIIAISPNLFAR
jgi:hypothetical protein